MSGVQQAVFQNQRSFGLKIGDAYEGGFFAGQISTAGNGIADYNLVVGPVSSAQSLLQWKTTLTTTAGTNSVIDGPANSSQMNNASHPAGQFCEGLTVGGFTDWYMPAKDELEVCYYNLKPDTTSNVTSSGANPYSVPARASNYTTGNPARTSAAAFTSTEAFTANMYWASTQGNTISAWFQYFSNGTQRYTFRYKNESHNVRAIRRVAV